MTLQIQMKFLYQVLMRKAGLWDSASHFLQFQIKMLFCRQIVRARVSIHMYVHVKEKLLFWLLKEKQLPWQLLKNGKTDSTQWQGGEMASRWMNGSLLWGLAWDREIGFNCNSKDRWGCIMKRQGGGWWLTNYQEGVSGLGKILVRFTQQNSWGR